MSHDWQRCRVSSQGDIGLGDVEIILAARGMVTNDESIREWGLRFGR